MVKIAWPLYFRAGRWSVHDTASMTHCARPIKWSTDMECTCYAECNDSHQTHWQIVTALNMAITFPNLVETYVGTVATWSFKK